MKWINRTKWVGLKNIWTVEAVEAMPSAIESQRTPKALGFAALAALLAALAIAPLTGCKSFFKAVNNSGGTTSSTTSYVYVANIASGASGGTITEYTLTSGTLAQVSGSPISLPSGATPNSIVVAPNNEFLFVGTSLGVYVYTIASGGALTEGYNNSIVSAIVPVSMAVDSTSTWLILGANSSTLTAVQVSATTGSPTSAASTAVLGASSVQQVTISAANTEIAIAMGAAGTKIVDFSSSATSSLGDVHTINLASTASIASNAVAFDTTSAYLFIAEAGTSTGVLRLVKVTGISNVGTPLAVGQGPSSILPEATGTYVYVANQTDNTISGFTFSAGALSALDASPFDTAKSPIALSEDASSTYLFAAGFGNNPNLWEYTLDSSVGGTFDVMTTTSTTSTSPSNSIGLAVTH